MMKDQDKTRKSIKLDPRDLHTKWIWLAAALVFVNILVALAVAFYHDATSSALSLRELASTDILFRVFLALTIFSLILFLGLWAYPILAARIKRTDQVDEPEVEEKQPSTLPDEQPLRITIDNARLRSIFDSAFMQERAGNDGKTYLDRVVEDLQIVRDNYKKGAKQDAAHYSDKNIIEIASILHKDRYFRRVYNSFTEWCCILFQCLSIEPPKRDNIKNPQEVSNQVKKRFYYLLSKEE
ncbi:MAG: hypothetical protein IJL91_15235 [Bacteroidales bacterium]|nr:hypothetical protein [Bacteroidales bacterium]